MLMSIIDYYVLKDGRCYCQLDVFVADVLATVVMSDGMDMRPDVVALVFVRDVVVTCVFVW